MKLIKLTGVFLFVFFFSSPLPTLAKVFQWVDDKGRTHFTDDSTKIPVKYRAVPEKPSEGEAAKHRVAIGGGYSFKVADNWRVEKRGSLRYKLIFTKQRDGYEPSCALDEFKRRGSFKKFVKDLQLVIEKRFKGYKKIDQTEFYAKPLKGIKVSEQQVDMAGRNVKRFLYYFKISNRKKIVVTCSVAEATGSKYNDSFDEIVSSLKYQ